MHSLKEAPYQVRETFFVGAAKREIQQMAAAFHTRDGTMPYAKHFVTIMMSSVFDPTKARRFWELPQGEFFHALTKMLTGSKEVKARKALLKEDWVRMEVKDIRAILQSDPWRDRVIPVFLNGLERFVKLRSGGTL